MDTVTLQNGLKSLFGTSQTTATNIPTCAGDGTPAGNISVANLASVLGVGPVKPTFYVEIPAGGTKTIQFANSASLNGGGFRAYCIEYGSQGRCCVCTCEWNSFTMIHDKNNYFANNFTFSVSGANLSITNNMSSDISLSIY